jgi:hypothetical protein
MKRAALIAAVVLRAGVGAAEDSAPAAAVDLNIINCGNLVYAANQTSVCFADEFLKKVAAETRIEIRPSFVRVPLDSPELFNFPFCVFSGEDSFSLTPAQRDNLRTYLLGGGFILASPGCSDEKWDKAFRTEIKLAFPGQDLQKLPMDHSIFHIVRNITALRDKSGKSAQIEGLTLNDRVVLVYSHEGLNDVGNAEGCCCCGGNEIRESQDVNVNVLTYALLY